MSQFTALRESFSNSGTENPGRAWWVVGIEKTELKVWGDQGVKRAEHWKGKKYMHENQALRCI